MSYRLKAITREEHLAFVSAQPSMSHDRLSLTACTLTTPGSSPACPAQGASTAAAAL